MILRTPAKINIGLNVVRKREDGYHDIETVFYPINLYDKIKVEPSDKLEFHSSLKVLEQDHNNLIIKAVKSLEYESGRKFNLKILLEKNIPVGAGLGGGSSDAAAMLLHLNNYFQLNISLKRLQEIALNLGSDIPYFLKPLPSFAQSRGEILETINLKIPHPILIVNPGIHISTGMAFLKVKPSVPQNELKKILLSTTDYSEWKDFITNDFESVIFDLFPEVGEIKSRMYFTGAKFSLMTGTGSTVFGIYPDVDLAKKAENEFIKKYYTFIHYDI